MNNQMREKSYHNKSNRTLEKIPKVKNSSLSLMKHINTKPSDRGIVHDEELESLQHESKKFFFSNSSKLRLISNLNQSLTEKITVKYYYTIRSAIVSVLVVVIGSYVVTKIVVAISLSTHSIDLQHLFTLDISEDLDLTDNNDTALYSRNATTSFLYHVYHLFSKNYKGIIFHIPHPLLSLWGDSKKIRRDDNAQIKKMRNENKDDVYQYNKDKYELERIDSMQKYKPRFEHTYIQAESNQSFDSQKTKKAKPVKLEKMESDETINIRNKGDFKALIQPLNLIEKELSSFAASISLSPMPNFQINQNRGVFNNLHHCNENLLEKENKYSHLIHCNDQEHISNTPSDEWLSYQHLNFFRNKLDGIIKNIEQINGCFRNNHVFEKNIYGETGSFDKVFYEKKNHNGIHRQRKQEESESDLLIKDATFERAQKIATTQIRCPGKLNKETTKDKNIVDHDTRKDEKKRKKKSDIKQISLAQRSSNQVRGMLNDVTQEEKTITSKTIDNEHLDSGHNSPPLSQPSALALKSSMTNTATVNMKTKKEIFMRKPNKCDIPFAYIASARCRRQSEQMPLLDMDSFLHIIF